jgi:uncharacterized protein (DUF305 family)
MKRLTVYFKLPVLLSLLGLVACKKDDEGLQVQPHDQNVMMQIMHTMMDRMDSMPMTGDPDQDFAMMMRMHHQGAIDMANEELQRGNDAAIKAMAQKVITTQQAEINVLTTFLASHQVEGPPNEAFMMMQKESMAKMMKANDLRVITGDADNDFVALMIDHHQSAIENSQSELQYGKHEEMKTLAQQIIDEQKKEISDFQDWLLGNKPY